MSQHNPIDLHSILLARLENVKPAPDGTGWTAACPICRLGGHDSAKDHLRVWKSSRAFSCAKHKGDTNHNRLIRAFIYDGLDDSMLAALDTEIVDPEPRPDVEKVYPESYLTKLVPDYRYWVGRGISEEVLRKLEGGLVPSNPVSKLSGYFTFPVRDDGGRIVGWTSRMVDESSLRPKHKHLVRASRAVYPWYVAEPAIRATGRVCLTEGAGDALSWASHGMWNWLLLFGLNLNSRIIGKLVALNPREIVISTNNDALTINPKTGKPKDEGNKAAAKVRAKLVPFFGEDRVIIDLPKAAKDWSKVLEINPDELKAFVERMTKPIV